MRACPWSLPPSRVVTTILGRESLRSGSSAFPVSQTTYSSFKTNDLENKAAVCLDSFYLYIFLLTAKICEDPPVPDPLGSALIVRGSRTFGMVCPEESDSQFIFIG